MVAPLISSCFFDLEKAFDSVEFPTLLTHMFQLGVNGKCWRILKDWYSNAHSVVKVNQSYSESFPVNRGVKQGSVLSPTLFIAVMDALLSYLESSGQGLSVCGLDAGSSAHADDVRAASISIEAARLSGTLAVLQWRGASALTITRFQRARGVAVQWGAARVLAS